MLENLFCRTSSLAHFPIACIIEHTASHSFHLNNITNFSISFHFCQYQFPMPNVTNYHKLRALEQHILLFHSFGGQKSKIGLSGPKIKVSTRIHFFWRLWRSIHLLAASSISRLPVFLSEAPPTSIFKISSITPSYLWVHFKRLL